MSALAVRSSFLSVTRLKSFMSTQLVPRDQPDLPAILAGSFTPAIRARVEDFFSSLASIFESWVVARKAKTLEGEYRHRQRPAVMTASKETK